MHRYKPGTLVTGSVTFEFGRMHVNRATCEDHIYTLTSRAEKVDLGSGWMQHGECLMCGRAAYADISWWQERVTAIEARRALVVITEEITQLRLARKILRACVRS